MMKMFYSIVSAVLWLEISTWCQ